MAAAAKLEFPWPCGLRSPTVLMRCAACRTAFQWIPSSPAVTIVPLTRLPGVDSASVRTSTGSVLSLSFDMAGPTLTAKCCLPANSLIPRSTFSASARLSPRV